MIGIHPERVTGEPGATRWVVPPTSVPPGRVRHAPGELGRLFADGTLTAGLVEHAAVWLWLRDGLSWREQGAAVSAALRHARAEPDGWVIEPAPAELLERVTADLLGGSVGDFVRSHGGTVAVHRVHFVWRCSSAEPASTVRPPNRRCANGYWENCVNAAPTWSRSSPGVADSSR